MKFGIIYGDRYEFRDGPPTVDGVLLLLSDELAMMMYIAMNSRAKQVHFRGSRLLVGGCCLVVKLALMVVSLIGRSHE